jgi:hypothetical protein
VFVSLCDNEFQGIVPVSKSLGNGKAPNTNLYWGAMYGMKSFFKYKAPKWELVASLPSNNPNILERLLFKHTSKDAFLLADAYDGEKIKDCIEDFLMASNRQDHLKLEFDSTELNFGGASNLLAFIGHNGLMDFDVSILYKSNISDPANVIILACYSKHYFSPEIKKAEANPILWTTHLMAPEAYTLRSAIDGWLSKETGTQIDERAAQSYNKYQKCGIKGARKLFTTGY